MPWETGLFNLQTASLSVKDSQIVPCKVIQIPESRKFCLWNPQSWVWNPEFSSNNPDSRYKRLESGIWNLCSTDKESEIQYQQFRIHDVESIQSVDCIT